MTHTVQKGDTLWKLSKAYGVSLEALIAANPQIPNPDKIDVGMQVNIPSGGTVQAPAETPSQMGMPEHSTMPAPDMAMAAPMPDITHTPVAEPAPPSPTVTEPAYPSVPKWEGLWKYVVKNGDSLFKIAKQVGVTLEQLKAANPQVPNPDKIYVGQVLNIPSSGLKPKSGNPGFSLKEQMTAPIGASPLSPKELLTQPKEMAPVETPITAPVTPIPAAPVPMNPFEINANINWAPHVNKETNVGYFPHHNQAQQAQAVSPAATGPITAKQEMDPAMHWHMMQYYHQMMPYWHMYYIPVTMKKKHHKKCHKHHKCGCGCHSHCGCHKKHHQWVHPHTHLMYQHMGATHKTFYRDGEED